MKLFTKAALVLATSAAFATSAQAVNFTNASGQFYAGAKVGQMLIDDPAPDLTGFGVYGGYNFDNNFGIEAEYLGSAKKDLSENVEFSANSYGLYGTYRYHLEAAPVYLKAKLGYAKSEGKFESKVSSAEITNDVSGFTYGVGAGYKINNNINAELGYSKIADDASFVALGAHFAF